MTEESKGDLVNLSYKVKTIASEKSLDYITLIMRRMDDLLLDGDLNKEEISMCFKELWVFLAFLVSMDSNKYVDLEGRKIIRRALSTKAGLRGIPPDIGRTIIYLFLNECEGNGVTAHDTLEILNHYISVEGLKVIDLLVPESDITSSINDFFGGLKKKFAESNLKNFIKKVKKNDECYGTVCELAFASRNLFWFKSIKEIGLLRLLSTYAELDDGIEGGMKPPIIEVLHSNFESFKALLAGEGELESKGINLIKMKYERLLELPVKYSFNKFRTVIKEVSESLQKKIKFKLSGDEGSLHRDKLQLLQDSMMHLVRNSLDHGIESPEIRMAKGKPEMGIVEIECDSKNPKNLRVIIRDDGGGIDANKICAKGVSTGLISEEEATKMTESDKLNLIFASTLSTKDEVSEISGRGVGMDVVKKNLEEIGSHIEIKTKLGKGTEFIIDIAV
jgi:two-component sensor histidine kinase